MLRIINLYTIDKILREDVTVKLSAKTQMIYINCLIHHFRNKPPKISSIMAFEIFEEDIDNFEKYRKNFQELHKSGLITIGQKSIVFNNFWGRHIDQSKLEKVSPESYVAGFNFQPAADFREELLNSQKMVELAGMKHQISATEVVRMIEIFIKEQSTLEKKYANFSDCISHFNAWLGKNTYKTVKSVVKSNSKILGMP